MSTPRTTISPSEYSRANDPPGFLWGVATSAYQLEGAVENDWTLWEREGRLKERGTSCGEATGHRERWASDLDLLPTIGANAYRFSVEWSRIEPTPGAFDAAALEHDRRLAQRLVALGIEPVVTLHHYTHPVWFWNRGGWESAESVAAFRRFAERVGESLHGLAFVWVTLNEPVVFLLGGYIAGVIPPGKKSFASASRAFQHLLEAHVEAAAALKAQDGSRRVGIAHNMLAFAAERASSPLDRRLVHAGERLYNDALLEAIATGTLDWSIPGEGRIVHTLADLPRTFDYAGLNYYSRVHLKFSAGGATGSEFFYRDPESRGLTDMGWEVHPQGFDRVLSAAARSGLPVVVLENGIATRDDRRRRDFLREHALVLAHRIRKGTPVAGYFYWSLLDNFEWLEGFRPRFGLFEVDYGTFARRRRPSADLFAALGRSFTSSDAPPAAEAGGRSGAGARR